MARSRIAIIAAREYDGWLPSERLVQRYLPSNYGAVLVEGRIVITGTDVAGWTMDGYVLPRLASGGIHAKEEVAS